MHTNRRSLLRGLSQSVGLIALLSLPSRSVLAAGASAQLPKGAKSQFAQVNGFRMHYVRAGSGPLVVLLHGWPETWFSWKAAIDRLSSRYTVIAPDLRGCGLSERTEAGYDKRTISDDVRALILAAGFQSAHVVGHDMGGKAAYVLGHRHPDVVDKLVLADCLVPGTENMDPMRGGAWHYGFHMAPTFPEMLTKGREREYLAAQIRAWSHRKSAIGEAAIDEYARHYAGPGGMTAGFNYYRALREDAEIVAPFRGASLEMPVMAITGRHGVGERLSAALEPEAAKLKSVVVEDCGHFVAEESPEVFLTELTRFIST